jgi:ABC-type branched-subunit amino acid transport system substrate-binding protein
LTLVSPNTGGVVRTRSAWLLIIPALLLAACGSRLSDSQREAAIGAGGGRNGTGTFSAAGDDSGDLGDTGTGTDGSGGGAGDSASTGGGGGGGGGGESTGGGGGGGGGDNPAAEAPAGGNGGATDVGVTGNEITIANVSDISGPRPGLFKSSQQATQAFVAYQNSIGGIYGRQLKLLNLDSQTDAGANRTQTLEACKKAFALVGSMSAMDNGGAADVDKCGIPDFTSIPTNADRGNAKNMYAPFPNGPKHIAMGPATYVKEKYGDSVIKKAAMLYIDGAVTKGQAERVIESYESIGFKFIQVEKYNVVEANFTPMVLRMKSNNIQYVTGVADYSSLVRIQQAMRQQNFNPKMRDWNSVVYDPGYIKQGGAAVEGSNFFLNTIMLEDGSSPERDLYLQWLDRVAPGAEPTYFGLYAWSAGRLFAKAATDAGAKLTRAGILAAVQNIHKWDGYGLHVAHDVGAKIPSNCFLYGRVDGGKFVRESPKSGWTCDKGSLYNF